MDRVLPRRANSFDYVVPHGKAITAAGWMGFDSCQVQTVTNGLVNLMDYAIVVWACGNQSTADRTFNAPAQAKMTSFLAAGGCLFVSGAEIAWDLDRASGPTVADRSFLHNQLHASLNGDTNDDAAVYTFAPAAGSIFVANANGVFDDGSRGIYWTGYPDALTPTGLGAEAALLYPGFSGGAAGIRYDGSGSGGKVVFLGLLFETITSEEVRAAYMTDVLRYFSRPALLELTGFTAENWPRLVVNGEPGLSYEVHSSTNLVNWITVTNGVNANGVWEIVDPYGDGMQGFYRASAKIYE